MFCKVERSYIEDGFNLYGLRACVSNFSDCLDLILDRIGPDDSDDSHLTLSACTLYGLIHARYIITAHGLDAMYNKYANKEFGTCPLIQCGGQPVLPIGLKDEMGSDTVKIFCPKCQNVYHPNPYRHRTLNAAATHNSASVDGAAFGTTFAHLFLMTFNNLVPDGLPEESVYVPRVFGFRVHPTARQKNGTNLTGGAMENNTTNTASHHRGGNSNSTSALVARPAAGTSNGVAETVENHVVVDSLPLQPNEIVADKTVATSAAAIADNAGGGGVGDDANVNDQSKGKKVKGRKNKSDEGSGSSKRRGKNGNGDHHEGNSSQKTKRQKRP